VTSNEIAIREQPHDEVDSWTAVMPSVVKLAEYIAGTDFVPKALRDKPAAIAAAILSGREMNIGPMRALAHVHMIEGRPSLSAEQKRAAALAAGHEISYVETSTTRCIVKGRRKNSQEWTTVTWTKDDAKNANLAGRENWRKWPRRMLQARATGELVDLLFPDASAGLATMEELVDDTDSAGVSNGEVPKQRTAQRKTVVTNQSYSPVTEAKPEAKEANPQPPLPGEEGYDKPLPLPEPIESGPTAGITEAQLTKLHTVFSHLDWTDRDDRLRAASVIVGRKLGSSKDLSKAEAVTLINTLEICAHKPDPQQALTDLLAAVDREEADVDGAAELLSQTFDAEIVEEGE
jgi:hypothetical protein